MKKCIAIVVFSLLAGCAQNYYRPDTTKLTAEDYGAPVEQSSAEAVATNFLSTRLKDPDSAKFLCDPVQPGVERDAMIYGGNVWTGYVLHCGVNAKNSFGGYTGYEPFTFVFRNGYLVRAYRGQGAVLQ